MNERVSVVIPCYKQAHLLPRALESLEKQNHRDLEVIIVDDGSPEPATIPAVRYPFHVRLIRIANRGLSGARNVGLRCATGNWIKFLDADDALLPDCIALQHASMGGRADTISIIGFLEVNEDTGKRTSIFSAFGDLREALLQINIGPPHIYMYPTKAVLGIGGFHEGERVQGGHEDYDLVMRLSAAGYHAVSVHKLGAVYYRRTDTMATFREPMDRTRVAVWAAFAGSVVKSGQCSPRLLLAALAGWIRHADITPGHLAGPLTEAASELAEMLKEGGSLLPKTEVDILRTRLLRHDSVGAKRLLAALPKILENESPLFSSPQEVIDRRLGFASLAGEKGHISSIGRGV
jgi:GT2 family glycosyltransferase